jgi:hypothetical protein
MGSTDSKSATLTAGSNKNIYISGTTTSHKTELAKKLTPPRPPMKSNKSSIVILSLFIALFGLIALELGYTMLTKEPDPELPPSLIFPIILLGIGVAIIIYSYKSYTKQIKILNNYDNEMKHYETSIAEYSNKYLCLRCGAEFKVD